MSRRTVRIVLVSSLGGVAIAAVVFAVEYLLGPGEWCGRQMIVGGVYALLAQVGMIFLLGTGLLTKRTRELKEESFRRDSP